MYSLKNFPNTTIQLKKDGTFKFYSFHPNPYLHPFDHPDEYYFYTSGNWYLSHFKEIYLTSYSDSLEYSLYKIAEVEPKNDTLSYYTFFNKFEDTIPILYVQYPDSSVTMRLHGTMPNYWEDFQKADSIEFHFYGYPPFTAIKEWHTNKDFNITLIPIYLPGYFDQSIFRYRRNRLFDLELEAKFRRVNNDY